MANNTTQLSTYFTTNSQDCLVLQYQDFIPWNNTENIIDYQTMEVVRKVKMLVFLPITALIGVPANIINMVVFYRHGLKERINVCLFALSLADGLFLVFNVVNQAEDVYLHFTTGEQNGPFREFIFNHYILGFFGVIWVSQVLSAIVACEKCFCILQPLKSQAILSTSTMTAIIVAIFVVVIGLRFIVNTRYYVICAYDPIKDKTIMAVTGSKFYFAHRQLVDFLDVFVYGLGIPWVVIVVVVSTTAITVMKLRQAAEWRADMSSINSSVSARDIALIRMLVGNSIFFIVCVFPVGLFRVSLLFMPEVSLGRRHHNFCFTGLRVGHILSYINSSFNIVIYYTMGSRYRHTVHSLLRRKITKEAPSKIPVSDRKTLSTVT